MTIASEQLSDKLIVGYGYCGYCARPRKKASMNCSLICHRLLTTFVSNLFELSPGHEFSASFILSTVRPLSNFLNFGLLKLTLYDFSPAESTFSIRPLPHLHLISSKSATPLAFDQCARLPAKLHHLHANHSNLLNRAIYKCTYYTRMQSQSPTASLRREDAPI